MIASFLWQNVWQNDDWMMHITLNAQIFYMNFVSEKHVRRHLPSNVFPFQDSVHTYPNWITKSRLDSMTLVTIYLNCHCVT